MPITEHARSDHEQESGIESPDYVWRQTDHDARAEESPGEKSEGDQSRVADIDVAVVIVLDGSQEADRRNEGGETRADRLQFFHAEQEDQSGYDDQTAADSKHAGEHAGYESEPQQA